MGKTSQYSKQLKSGANKGLAFEHFKEKASHIEFTYQTNIAALNHFGFTEDELKNLSREDRLEAFNAASPKSEKFTVTWTRCEHAKQLLFKDQHGELIDSLQEYAEENEERAQLGMPLTR